MPESKFRAVIWDMDGVIADTAPYHFAAWHEIFQRRGVNLTEGDFQHLFGQRNDTITRTTIPGVSPEEIEAITREKEESFRRRVSSNVKALPGAIELIRLLFQNGIKMAIASSAPMENIRLITQSLGIKDCFQATVFGREVKEGKPSPQGYLLAAQKLGVAPEDCIVIEDAVAGVTGARRAGMKCLAVTNTHPRESLEEADLVVDSLESVTISDFEKLFNNKE